MRKQMRAVIDALEFEGVKFKVTGTGDDIQAGDTYLAERNTGVRLLTCRSVPMHLDCIFPVENAYAYDTKECVKIELAI